MNDSTTRVRLAPERNASSDGAFLVLTRSSTSNAVGRVFRLGNGEAIVGRSSEAQLQIEEDGISRKHVRVFTGPDGRYWVEDLQSTNGTFLNGVRTRTARLEEGDQIQIGSATALRFSFKPSLAEAEEHLRRALAASQVATFSWDLKTEALTWSELADQIGHAPLRSAARTAKDFTSMVFPEDQELIRKALRRAIDARVPFDVEYRFQGEGSAVTWLASRGDVLRDDRDVPLRVVGTLMDITERKVVEQELRRHALLFESFDDAVVVVSREGVVLDWSSSGERMFGHSKTDALGKPYASLLGLADKDLLDGTRFGSLQAKWSGEQHIHRRDGGEVFCETVMVPLRAPEGQYIAAVVVHRDVTRQRALQSQLMMASRLASVGTLAAGVAHEINNPLAFVTANLDYLTTLLDTAVRPEAETARQEFRALLAETREGAGRIARIVRDLKTFSREDASADVGVIEVEGVLEFALQMTQNHLRHRARIEREFHPLPKVRANASRLGQVFLHLLINAEQAMSESASEQVIRVSCHTDSAGNACVEVKDTGEGIAPEVQERIFDPFFTTKPAGTASGLGLSISHAILKAFGGDITVQSKLGEGSVFRVTLPPVAETSGSPPEVGSAPTLGPW